jgi:hypothetical protein
MESIGFFSPIGCAAKSMEYMGKAKYNQRTMSVDLRQDFELEYYSVRVTTTYYVVVTQVEITKLQLLNFRH